MAELGGQEIQVEGDVQSDVIPPHDIAAEAWSLVRRWEELDDGEWWEGKDIAEVAREMCAEELRKVLEGNSP